ncbi:MAG: alcohol dehydrogenase catalytic domain-containing protein [Spirochaetaceae bacterium]|nr:alcohol dehydrogenase catalytic domain-containing protein [Spirochaetaceae bacterium]
MLLAEPLPERMRAWQIKGTGFERFGRGDAPDEIPFPEHGEDDVVARVDAVGVCFSDAKLVRAGAGHARLRGRDLAARPVTPGHEVALTVVGVGERRRGQVRLGGRYILQPDVYYRGRTLAVGYQLAGALAEYVVLGKEVLDGDEGCYLVPLPDRVGTVEAALIEPWTCVLAAYRIAARTHLRSGGTLRLAGFADQPPLDLAGVAFGAVPERLGVPLPPPERDAPPPRQVQAGGLNRANRAAVEAWCARLDIPLECRDEPVPRGADDVVVAGTPPGDRWMARLFADLPRHAVVSVHVADAAGGERRHLACDIGRIHYQGIRVVGRGDGSVAPAYAGAAREGLVPGGRAWFVGGGGPMGQMHVLLALSQPHPPATVLVTDLSERRLAALGERVAALGLPAPHLLQVGGEGGPLEQRVSGLAGDGFDDVVLLAPSAVAAEQAAPFLRGGGYLNVFAGVAEGSVARIPLHLVAGGGVRVAGTTGSPLAVTEQTLARVADGTLDTAAVLGALADLGHGGAAVQAVAEGRITGKMVVLPFARGLGLSTLDELAAKRPEWRRALGSGCRWTSAAEELCRAAFGYAGGPGGTSRGRSGASPASGVVVPVPPDGAPSSGGASPAAGGAGEAPGCAASGAPGAGSTVAGPASGMANSAGPAPVHPGAGQEPSS